MKIEEMRKLEEELRRFHEDHHHQVPSDDMASVKRARVIISKFADSITIHEKCAKCYNKDSIFCLNEQKEPCLHFNIYQYSVHPSCFSFHSEQCTKANYKLCGDISPEDCPRKVEGKKELNKFSDVIKAFENIQKGADF